MEKEIYLNILNKVFTTDAGNEHDAEITKVDIDEHDKYYEYDFANATEDELKVLDDPDFKFVREEQHGGEDEGSDYYVVFSVECKQHGKLYIKLQTTYQSHYGIDQWRPAKFVEKKEVTKTVFV